MTLGSGIVMRPLLGTFASGRGEKGRNLSYAKPSMGAAIGWESGRASVWDRLSLLAHARVKKTGRTHFSSGIGKSNWSPNFLAFDFMMVKENLVFVFIAHVYDFEPGTCLPCVSPALLYPVSWVASFETVQDLLEGASHIKGLVVASFKEKVALNTQIWLDVLLSSTGTPIWIGVLTLYRKILSFKQ